MKKKLFIFGLFITFLLFSTVYSFKSNVLGPTFKESVLKSSDIPPIIPFKVGLMFGPVDLDPHYAWDVWSFNVIDQICEGLFRYNLSDPTLPIIPNLAVSDGIWSSDNLNFTISLRSGVTFHDGYEFNASGVQWSFDRLFLLTNLTGDQPDGSTLYGESLLQELYAWSDGTPIINRTEIVSEYVIKFILNKPYGAFKGLLCFPGSYILSPFSTPANDYIDPISGDLIGTGPFLYDGYTPTVEVNFTAYQNYWRGKTDIEKMIFKFIFNTDDRHTALLTGDIHFIQDVYILYLDTFKANSKITVLDQGINSNAITCLGMNNKFIAPYWRRAISYAIDYDYMITQLWLNRVVRLKSPIPEGILYANSSFDCPNLNITKAREILQDNGIGLSLNIYNDDDWISVARSGSPLATFNYTYNIGNTFREDFSVLLQNNLEYIGVKVIDVGLIWDSYLELISNVGGTGWDKLRLFWTGWMADFNDPSNYLNNLMSNTSISNCAQINDPLLEMLLEEGLSETDPIARETIYDTIQQYLVEDLIPWAWGYTPLLCDAHSKMLSNFQQNTMKKLNFYSCEWRPYEMSVSSPSDMSYVEGTTGHNITWYINAEYNYNPNYTLYVNDIFNKTGGWNPSVPLNFNVDGLSVGVYEFRLEISNGDESAQTSTNVTVIPLELSITHPNDISFTEGRTGNSLSWTITTNAEFDTIYYIYSNNIPVYNDTWHSDVPVIYSLDELSAGEYSIRIVAYNGAESVEDTVMVTVNSPEEIIPGYPLLILLGLVMILTILITLKKKSNS